MNFWVVKKKFCVTIESFNQRQYTYQQTRRMPVNIEVRDGNVGKSMMQLKRTLIREGLFKELKKRKFYIKPSVAKRLKREAAEKQRNKDLKRELRAAQKADF